MHCLCHVKLCSLQLLSRPESCEGSLGPPNCSGVVVAVNGVMVTQEGGRARQSQERPGSRGRVAAVTSAAASEPSSFCSSRYTHTHTHTHTHLHEHVLDMYVLIMYM